jgi:hypothetical protein
MSAPFLLQDVGASILQIAGTFLLAVEAIKLENLRKLRDVVFGGPLRMLTPSVKVPAGATEADIARSIEKKRNQIFLLLGLVGFAFLSLLLSLAVPSISDTWALFRSQFSEPWWMTVIAAFFALCLTMFFSLLTGFIMYKLLLLPFQIPFVTLEFIERNTAKGGIGMLGFFLFFVGSVAQIWIKFAA